MLIDVLRAAAQAQPDRDAMVAPERSITYAELVLGAERVARDLEARAIDRFGIAAQDPIDVLVLLAAASACGAEACVYPRNLQAGDIGAFAARLDHGVVVGDPGLVLDGISCPAVGELGRDDGTPVAPEDGRVLILTTGTSGVPKGVRHEWRRLLGAVRRSAEDEGARWLLAYNPNQFAAFQVLLHAFVHQSTVIAPRSSQARDAMAAMLAEDVTHVSATPTFWRLLVGGMTEEQRTTLRLRQITLGGEATPESLIARLRELFPAARISHVYAGTEFGSVVSVRDGRAGLPLSVLERSADAGAQFRVVDGELHVRSASAMLGYHGGGAAGEWHPTGDLVEERDGRLHFVGRTVEIINVGGAKVHPLPIEERVATVPGVVVAAVYGRPNAITGQIVAVDVVIEPGADADAVKAGIQEACMTLPAPGRPRRITVVDALNVRGEKVVRRGAAEDVVR